MGVGNAVRITQPMGAKQAKNKEGNRKTSPSRTLDLMWQKRLS
jgi:hypothetical protein